jgi:hypothetical protein
MKRLSKEEVERELIALDGLGTKALQQRWRKVYRTEPPPKIQSGLLRLAVAYRIQERAFGGLKPASKRQMKAHLETLARRKPGEAFSAQKAAIHLTPGTQLVREWNGATLLVDVVADGFRWKDTTYRTLSAVAVAITGTKWSGPKFFGLTAARAARALRPAVAQP